MTIDIAVRGTPLNDEVDRTVYTMVDAGTPTPNRLLIAFVLGRSAADNDAPLSFTGYGLTWTSIGGHSRDTGFVHTEVYVALTGSSPNSTDPEATWSVTRTCGQIHVVEVSLTSYATTAIRCIREQSPGERLAKSAVTGTALDVTFDLAPAEHPNNRPLMCSSHGGAVEGTTPRTNWTELTDGGLTPPTNNMETQWRSDTFEATTSASWATSSARYGVALEIIDDPNPPTRRLRTVSSPIRW